MVFSIEVYYKLLLSNLKVFLNLLDIDEFKEFIMKKLWWVLYQTHHTILVNRSEPTSPEHPLSNFQYWHNCDGQTDCNHPIYQRKIIGSKSVMQGRYIDNQEQHGNIHQDSQVKPFICKWFMNDRISVRSEIISFEKLDQD